MSEKELDEFYGRAFDSKNMEIIKLRAEIEQLKKKSAMSGEINGLL